MVLQQGVAGVLRAVRRQSRSAFVVGAAVFLLGGCTSYLSDYDDIRIQGREDIVNLREAWARTEFVSHQTIWQEEFHHSGDRRKAGKAAYAIADAAEDMDWANLALHAFELRAELPSRTARDLAWFGAANGLFQRLHHVFGTLGLNLAPGYKNYLYARRARENLEAAYDLADNDPQVLFLRALTYGGFPQSYGLWPQARADFDRVTGWVEDPASNEDFRSLLTDTEWQKTFWRMKAERETQWWLGSNRRGEDGQDYADHARQSWRKVVELTPEITGDAIYDSDAALHYLAEAQLGYLGE